MKQPQVNKVRLIGEVVEFNNAYEDLYVGKIKIPRNANTDDVIPFRTHDKDITVGCTYLILGKVKTEIALDTDGLSHKLTYVETEEIYHEEPDFNTGEIEYANKIELEGYLVNRSNMRTAGYTDKKIIDFVLAYNKQGEDSSYPNLIAWQNNVYPIVNAEIGNRIKVTGKLQSRQYVKNETSRTVYEINCGYVEVL